MKIRKIISIIVLIIIITLVMTFGSLATEDSVNVNENTNKNVENNIEVDLENNEENTDENNKDNNDNIDLENTEEDEIESNDKSEDGNIESDDNDNQEDTENNDNNNSNSENKKPTKPNKTDKDETDKNKDNNEQSENELKEEVIVEDDPIEIISSYSNNITQTKSENANLRALILDIEGLSPEFDKDITEYYLIVDLSVESVDIEAYPEDNNSIVIIDGNTELEQGENTISITVKAEAGNTKTYTIYVTKTDDVELVNANLKNLSVKGFNFYPSFKSNIYNYNLTINEKVSQLEIIVEPEIEEATYKIIGNENLVEGDNLIKILVTAQDGVAKREYKLNLFISSKNVEVQETSKVPAIVLLSVLSVAIIGTTISIFNKKHI